MAAYPSVLSEEETIARAHAGASLARYGDGELKLALGFTCVSQIAVPALSRELKHILAKPSACLPCIPNAAPRPPRKTKEAWRGYAVEKYRAMYGLPLYGSAFISRPDSAPWIDTPEYWDSIDALWRGRDVVLVKGTERSLTEAGIGSANSVRVVDAPRRDAYAEIDRIEEEIGKTSDRVLLCVGATSTVLAWRLAQKNIHALDLGHLGMFMRHAGAYRYRVEDLISSRYQAQLAQLHGSMKSWGGDGGKHVDEVIRLADTLEAKTILDYGCGEGALKTLLAQADPPRRVMEFDPGMPGKEGMPKPCDLTVCTDVLEHVEKDKLTAVLDHMYRITSTFAYVVIATRLARALLPDGRNAHLIVKDGAWWLDQLRAAGWTVERSEIDEGKEIRAWLRK